MSKKDKKSKDLDAKTSASKVRGGRMVPFDDVVEREVVKPLQGSSKKIQRGFGR